MYTGYFSFLRNGHVWDVSFRQGRASSSLGGTKPLSLASTQLWTLKAIFPQQMASTKLVPLKEKLLGGCC